MALFHNNYGGTFTNVAEADVTNDRWSTGVAEAFGLQHTDPDSYKLHSFWSDAPNCE